MKKILLIVILALGFEMAGQSEFQVSLDTNQIKIGEAIQLQIEAAVPMGSTYLWPTLSDSIRGLEIIERGKIDSTEQGDFIALKQIIRFTSFDSGDVYVPALALKVGEQSFQSDSSLIRVFFPELKADQDYYDIKAPREIPFNYWLILWYALGALALGLLIYFIYLKWPRKTVLVEEQAPFDPRSPREWALDALKDLEEKELWQKGKEKAYYSELIDILRHFLEREYGMKAMESTAEELIQKLDAKVGESELRSELNTSLRLSAMVKYARQKALPYENEQALNAIRKFVDQHQKEEVNDV